MGQANSALQVISGNPGALRDKLHAASGSCPPANYRDGAVVLENAVLLSLLAELGASTPTCVYFGQAPRGQQTNLLLGRLGLARGSVAARHITEAFTDGERNLVIGDGGDGRHGMEVPVFDAEGRRYGLTCGYSDYAMCYRLFGAAREFGRFRANNRELRDVAVGKDKLMKVFTFRSPALRPVEVDLDDGHPDGALGMIVLFYDLDAKEAVKNELLDTDTLTVNQIMKHYPKLAQMMLN
ncbi:hypothetical protein OsJ_24004 [Oryza sativa Japonica Group]|uniref:Uncharacterized protein n=1 Tax=Oryza sativa subsp. japonica TaxID=39947 RepID=A3BJ28_ORYSJ|nr:hypothetical protein OsJ_24004 [Oryza sativa Japonica Group]